MFFSGTHTALVTPWTGDLSAVDYGTLRKLVDWQVNSGVDGLVIAGTTGESATLTHPEQEELIARSVEVIGRRCLVLAGSGSNNTAESRALAKAATAAGADALLVITPYYNRPTQEGLFRHYAAMAEASPLPIMIYNVPVRTGTNILPETVAKINREFPHVNAIKEASGNLDQISRLRQIAPDVQILSGDDSITLPIMAVGGTGAVSVISNLAPAATSAMVTTALRNDFAGAAKEHARLFPLMKACFVETNPGPVKAALQMMGKGNGLLRSPMTEPSPENKKIILDALRQSGLADGNMN
ncbi:MAG: 4-hydroxy-tetrahydrodipicolinate synthase [Planctomycetota bacterium]|jgi:4-hydroxy-tetrahydrodipicolinate synthase|nr:4-hydroxy-tetrahydrodipicolinate synthase [Planctomycetota bacterium]